MVGGRTDTLRLEYVQGQIADHAEVLGVSGAQGLGSFDCRGGNQRIGHSHAVLEGVLFQVDGRPVTNECSR